MPEFLERVGEGYGQTFRIDELLYEVNTGHQDLKIFENAAFGRVLVLDGIVQTTEKDEFIYHEMLAHVPILAHGRAARVLIIGGGDGGSLREVVKHQTVEQVVQVEIDQAVIDMCRRYLPNHSQGAFDDRRLTVVIDDGLNFVRTTRERFDVIISDSTDPEGPGEALFLEQYYTACKRCLNPGGILVTQNGVVFFQREEVRTTARRLKRVFADWHFYSAAIPTYAGGIMTFGWASDDPDPRRVSIDNLHRRYTHSGIQTRYYNPEIHRAAFALPQWVRELIGKPGDGSP